jgi:hypothetical protein
MKPMRADYMKRAADFNNQILAFRFADHPAFAQPPRQAVHYFSAIENLPQM